MTDQQTYIDPLEGSRLHLKRAVGKADAGKLFLTVSDLAQPASTYIPAAELLAMIDTADPDAMRAYLRETAPEVIADLYRPEIPEDVDERVPSREALLTDAQERRLYLIEQLTKTLPADEAPALAYWIITGGTDVLEDLTLSGEELNR